MDPLELFPEFMEAVRRRMEKGRCLYGDLSFNRPPGALRQEIEEEIFDIVGWDYVLWVRLRQLRKQLEKLEVRHERLTSAATYDDSTVGGPDAPEQPG